VADDNAAQQADSLEPTSATNRVFTTGSYVLMWWSSLIVVQAFALGQGFPAAQRLAEPHAGDRRDGRRGGRIGRDVLVERRAGAALRHSVFDPGALELRHPRLEIVELLRAVPAIVWCGIGTWIGALSLDGIVTKLTGRRGPPASTSTSSRCRSCRRCSRIAASAP
jgi:NCS1 family nucleobase:cation symporter-1